MVVLELEYPYEMERLKTPAAQILEYLESALDLGICLLPFHRLVMEALDMKWTRDPFDRLIVAQARAGQ